MAFGDLCQVICSGALEVFGRHLCRGKPGRGAERGALGVPDLPLPFTKQVPQVTTRPPDASQGSVRAPGPLCHKVSLREVFQSSEIHLLEMCAASSSILPRLLEKSIVVKRECAAATSSRVVLGGIRRVRVTVHLSAWGSSSGKN